MNIIIVTGLSGSGKSSVLNYLEDRNFYCVDNLPLQLFEKFIEILENSNYENIALGLDIREYLIDKNLKRIEDIKNKYDNIFILYLEASNETLYKRYNESRRKHPISLSNLEEAIKNERNILKAIKKHADYILYTDKLNIKKLYNELDSIFNMEKKYEHFNINITSFGFKYGSFNNAHLLFDVRFLPNPFFKDNLKNKNGNDSEVYDFVILKKETEEFLSHLIKLIDYILPLYKKERRYYLNIAVGCTGGKHRSVSVSRFLYNYLKENYNVSLNHRDIDKDTEGNK